MTNTKVWLNFEKRCHEKFCHCFFTQQLMLALDRRKFYSKNFFPNHRTTYIPYLLKINFLCKTNFLGKFDYFFECFQCKCHNCGYEGTKAFTECYWSGDLQNWSWHNGIKMLNDLISYSGWIFKQNHLFFIIQDCLNQGKALFYLKVLLGNNSPWFDKSPCNYISKTCHVETKAVSK